MNQDFVNTKWEDNRDPKSSITIGTSTVKLEGPFWGNAAGNTYPATQKDIDTITVHKNNGEDFGIVRGVEKDYVVKQEEITHRFYKVVECEIYRE